MKARELVGLDALLAQRTQQARAAEHAASAAISHPITTVQHDSLVVARIRPFTNTARAGESVVVDKEVAAKADAYADLMLRIDHLVREGVAIEDIHEALDAKYALDTQSDEEKALIAERLVRYCS